MKKLLIVAATLATIALSSCASAKSSKPLIFELSPKIEMDESANFKVCGYELRARIDENNLDTALQMLIYKNRENDYFVSNLFAKKTEKAPGWQPQNSVIQWVRIGGAEPLILDPYNLITTPSEGYSHFSTKKINNYNPFVEMENPTTNIWIQIFDRTAKETITYYGIINNNKEVNSLVRQCLESINSKN
jgi:hypothetical protein